ncbi:MAG: outer membrane protein assembly factor BamC [Polaribacter sp.]|jgi:outer membrane protein assembly factor BamC
MKFPLMAILQTIVALAIVGCGTTQDLRYLESQAVKQLEIPPDLTVTYQSNETLLPSNFSSDANDSKSTTGIPVLLKVDSLELEGQGDFHWLSAEDTVDDLFEAVKRFWSSEGFLIEIDEPAIGVVQTGWAYNEEGGRKLDTNFLTQFFSSRDLTATQNQFRTRIERDTKTNKNRIYIAHRGTAYKHIVQARQAENRKQNDWELVPPNSELEVEMLSRLMIYLGVQQAQLDEQLDRLKFFTPISSIHADYAENETYLLVKDVYAKTWYRTLHQLDRMAIEVVSSNIGSGTELRGVIRVKTDVEEEISEGGFFSIGGETKVVKKQVILVLTEESAKVTRISMVTRDGEIENSIEGFELITLLQQFLK